MWCRQYVQIYVFAPRNFRNLGSSSPLRSVFETIVLARHGRKQETRGGP